MVNPQWLRSFALLCQQESFTRTADSLGITQAAVSQHLRYLENHYGQLIVRSRRRFDLTPAGIALLEFCREMEKASQRLEMRLQENDGDCGDISLITPGSIGLRCYPLLLSLQQSLPGLAIRHRFAPDDEVLSAVLENRYELGLMTRQPDDSRLVAEPFAREPLELVFPAGKKVQSWQDLAALGFIDHPDGQAMATRLLSRVFPGNPGVRSLPCQGFSNQIALILSPVARGLGFTVLPRFARLAFSGQHEIEVMPCTVPVVDTIWLIHRAEWPLSGRAQKALVWLKDHLEG
ncbi:LysR family transcriptional regulator (plasmid) [Erwinia sp. INIA-01]|uniref:LysR family transcriptional regulator n=1 Tax=Erwinia sp. INIA01 TaxID=2991500 RepID=UPI002225495F|nr:LysR family transcriptional regulator [Erwinia sp. INIA01]MCW1873064.1 LysR family transcriptional regulator [Erwinia sp. INIA01]